MDEQPSKARDSARTDASGDLRAADYVGVRRAALELLLEAEGAREFMNELLDRKLRQFEERDRHLLQEVTYGALRHRNTLDHIVDFHLKFPTARQKAPVAWALRLGVYQLAYLERVPPHAAVNQTLEGLKALGTVGPGEVGFVNAVLHKVAAEIRLKSQEEPVDRDDPTVVPIRRGYCHFTRPVLPLRRLNPAAHLALKHSHPSWMIQRWLERYGEDETRELCRKNNSTPALTARVTRLCPSRDELLAALESEGWCAEPGPLEGSIVITKSLSLANSQTFAKHWFQIQDLTAMQIGWALRPPPGARVLDMCSAPGSKSAQILEAVGPEGHLVAADRSEEKLSLVRETLSRLGANYTAVLLPDDPARVEIGETFRYILVDAPCSNTGVLARRPEARWRVRPKDLQALAQLQTGILEAAFRHLAPGGKLLYATCSIEPDENENVVAQFFARHDGLLEHETRLFLPHRSPGDGGYYSLMMRPA